MLWLFRLSSGAVSVREYLLACLCEVSQDALVEVVVVVGVACWCGSPSHLCGEDVEVAELVVGEGWWVLGAFPCCVEPGARALVAHRAASS
jgi:hypothetical protein